MINKNINSNKLDENKVMNCGELATIVEYNGYNDIVIIFQKTGELVNSTYGKFKNGKIKSHFSPTIYDFGILGLEVVKDETGNILECYKFWRGIIRRCYSKEHQEKNITYKDCTVCEEWKYYANFKKWFNENYYEIKGQRMELDKDILIKGNKVYSPSTCVFVPQHINSLFTKCDKNRGNLPIGVSYSKTRNKFQSQCRIFDIETKESKQKHLGYNIDKISAFNIYKQEKEKNVKKVANHYKNEIPNLLYEAMVNYKVNIDD